MDLSLIAGALQVHQQVVLSGFGAFLQSPTSDGGSFQLTFTPFILRSDGAFEEYIASACGVSRADAAQRALQIAEHVREAVDALGYCNIAGLGSLRREANGMVLFSPEEVEAGLADERGSEDAFSLISTAEESSSAEGMECAPEAVDGMERYSNCSVPPVVATPFSEPRRGRGGRLWVWLLLVLVIVGGGVYAAWRYGLLEGVWASVQAYGAGEPEAAAGLAVAQGDMPSDAGAMGEVSASGAATEDSSLRRDYEEMASRQHEVSSSRGGGGAGGATQVEASALPGADRARPYHIVLGSFTSAENADRFARRMSGEGFQAAVLPSAEGAHRVVLCSYQSQEQALVGLSSVRRRFANAWLYCP